MSFKVCLISFSALVYMVSSQPVPSPQQKVNQSLLKELFCYFIENVHNFQVPNCSSLLSQSLPECQARQAGTYGNFGEVWGEITVDVSSPVLIVTEPEERKEKRKEKRRNKNKKNKNKKQQRV